MFISLFSAMASSFTLQALQAQEIIHNHYYFPPAEAVVPLQYFDSKSDPRARTQNKPMLSGKVSRSATSLAAVKKY
ncbi:hypothetical protein QBC36DRAFT_326916 [Triangularia setosa]|uniref:Uncharacterized protein n=1 Tax=Triangularia setosa TaxID=2587417 RepID=A0AAN7A805_9PEZI|nr:hypothetical protein QBC36DRAFT_326916 [Podospora setosa]